MNKFFLEEIDATLKELIDRKKSSYPNALHSAMEYALFPGGKRVRPYLTYIVAQFVGIDIEIVKPLAIAIELIHSYSLIHDDMPCMDNDDYRRGKLSCHKAFGEGIALLAGDALLNLAYEVLFDAVVENSDLAQSASIIAKCAGAEGMIGGQAIEFSEAVLDEGLVTELCKKKTGALINAAVMAPAVLSADRDKFNALSAYANALGLAFQLCDDLLDEDKHEEKSYLGVMGKEKTKELFYRLNGLSMRVLAKYGDEAQELIGLSEMLANRKK